MKAMIMAAMAVAGMCLPVHAGHGTIRETDTEIIVEFYGDPGDKVESAEKQVNPGSTVQQAVSPPVSAPVPQPQMQVTMTAAPVAKAASNAAKPQEEIARPARDPAFSARAAQRERALAMRRQQRGARQPGQPDTYDE